MKDFVNDEKSSKTKLSLDSTKKHLRISDLFDNLLNGIVVCSYKIFGIDNSRLPDENVKTTDERYTQMKSELSESKEVKFDNSLQAKEYRRKSKQLTLLEVQAELAQIKQNRKRFLKFWKKQG